MATYYKDANMIFKTLSGDIYHVRPITNAQKLIGVVPVASGGTGQATLASARNAMGLGNTTGALPIANGGTGQTTVAAARNALGLGNTTGAVPVANGGTGATDAATARGNLGAAPTSHTQAASTITAGTLAGQTLANAAAQATLTTAQLRNIYAGTAEMTPGTTALPTGTIYCMYE